MPMRLPKLYRGLPYLYRPTTPENNNTALQHFRNAIALEPTLAVAYGCAAVCFMWRQTNHWPADVVSDNAELSRLADRIKELDTDDAPALSSLGLALFYTRVNCEVGIEMVDRAIRSNPNYAQAYISRG
jgi:hypothetical protein